MASTTHNSQSPATNVLVVNMVPKSLSGETNQDSEPHLTVNPANPLQIVGTAFTPAPTAGPNAPVYVSLDGGNTWFLNTIVPSKTGSSLGTFDITSSFNDDGSKLYAGILRDPTANLEFLRTSTFSAPTAMTVLASRPNADQPFTLATTVAGQDRLYIGENDFGASGGKTQTLDESLNAGIATPPFSAVRVEKRPTAGQDGPQCRPACHTDGTVYAAFYGWRATSGSFPANTLVITSDVVVVRDDNGGSGASPFTALVDPGDGLAGLRVAKSVTFPFNRNGAPATGQQRIGGSISIVADPRNSATVYLAWGDQQPGSFLTLHVRKSIDRGKTWSAADLLTVPNATNAALAVNAVGLVGLLCQQVTGTGPGQRWVTRVSLGQDGSSWSDTILANTPATTPAKSFDPYLGDYDHMLAVGNDFYGVFSANNTPALANFPSGVKYQRNVNFPTQRLLNLDNVTPVTPSIDPFFFKINQTAAPVSIASTQFPDVFLRMDGTGVTQFVATGAGTVNSQFGSGTWEKFNLVPQGGNVFAIGSVQFPGVFLRMDGTGVSQFVDAGAGTVNCQFGIGPWERFNLLSQGDNVFAIGSVQFPGVFLRLDGSGVTQFAASGAGIVNCQFGAGPYEKFTFI